MIEQSQCDDQQFQENRVFLHQEKALQALIYDKFLDHLLHFKKPTWPKQKSLALSLPLPHITTQYICCLFKKNRQNLDYFS